MPRTIWSVLFVMLLQPFATQANDELLRLQTDPGQWVMQRKNYAATGYSELSQITANNVKHLKAAWTFSTGVLRGHEGAPLVVGTTMYVNTPFPNTVYALDLTQQPYAIKWSYTPQQNQRAVPVACCDTVHRGVNYVEGKIILPTLDGQVIALDANTGKELWKAKNADPTKGETITAAGLVIKDKYIASVSGGEFGVRCHVTAYNINTGQQVWRAYSMGPDEDLLLAPDFNAANPHYGKTAEGTKSWPGESWKQGGGCAWGWYSYDPALNLLYYGTGNPGPWNPSQRQGDNKWSLTVFARDPDSGMAKWGYQMTPWDAWDYDGVNESVLADLSIDGKPVKALVRFDRNGFTYILDRTNGTLLSADPYVLVNWATGIDKKTGRPIENPEKRDHQGAETKYICPNSMGGKDQQPSAYSPKTGISYVPTNNMCMDKEPYEVKYIAGVPYVGANTLMLPGPGGYLGELIAWDVTAAKKLWGIKEAQPVWSGVLATAGDVIFYGTLDGWFKAVHARTGEVLWKFKTGSGIIGVPISFTGPTDGKQYVAVYSGVGGWYGLPVAANLPPDDPYGALGAVGIAYKSGLNKVTTLGGTLYVFALD
jgi:PQQ-dependent dehydrogenase (methanol/ethanol family)